MTDTIDWLTLDDMVATGEAPREAWAALLRDPQAHLRWREAVSRRRWLEAFADIAARSPSNAALLSAARRALRDPGEPGAPAASVVVTRAIATPELLAATLRSSPRQGRTSDEDDDREPLDDAVHTLGARWGTIAHIDAVPDSTLTVENVDGAEAWWVTHGGVDRWPVDGWKVEQQDGVVVIISVTPRSKPPATLTEALAAATNAGIVLVHPAAPTGENED